MKTLTTESERKSKSLPASDFWAFYLANKKYLDEVIHFQACKYSLYVEEDDLRSEILYRFSKNRVLDGFDATKSALMTFVIARIKFYAQHIVTHNMTHGYGDAVYNEHDSRKKGIRGLTKIAERGNAEWSVDDPTEDSRTNNVIQRTDKTLTPFEDLSDEVDIRLKIEKLRRILPGDQRLILNRTLQGYNNCEIGRQFGVSSVTIATWFNKIKRRARRVLAIPGLRA